MIDSADPFRSAIMNSLAIMGLPPESECEFMDSIREFETLYESVDEILTAGRISEAEFKLLEQLHLQLEEMAERPDLLEVWRDEQFPVLDDWRPTRNAAAQALPDMRNHDQA